MGTALNKEKILSSEIDIDSKPPGDKEMDSKPPGDKEFLPKPPGDKELAPKPPGDKSITERFISNSINSGNLQIVYQLEIMTDGSAIMTMYKEKEKKKKLPEA